MHSYRQAADFEEWKEYSVGSRALRSRGLFTVQPKTDGTLEYRVAPTPTGGEVIHSVYIFRPADLVNGADLPPFPSEFHRAIIDYAKAVALGSQEDDPETEATYLNKVEVVIDKLRKLRQANFGLSPRDQLHAAEAATTPSAPQQ